MEEQNLRIASINTNGIDKAKIIQLNKLKDYDILLIQETHNKFTKTLISELERINDALVVINDSMNNDIRAGVAVVISNKCRQNWEIIQEDVDLKGRVIHIKLNKLHIINVYVPANRENHKNFLIKLNDYLKKYSAEHLILGGDFNWAGEEIDRLGKTTSSDKHVKTIMENLINFNRLTDVYRRLNILRIDYTYDFESLGIKNGSRIDRFYVSDFDDKTYKKAEILDFKISDHKLITLDIVIKNNRWGKSYWKFNNVLLNNENFINEVLNEIPKTITNVKGDKLSDIIIDWDKFKQKIKTIAIYHSNKRKRIKQIEKKSLF